MSRSPRRPIGRLVCGCVCAGALLSIALGTTRPGARPHEGEGERKTADPFTHATRALAADPSEKVRTEAALVLARLMDERATPFLIQALGDPSPAVRASAANGLGDIGDDRAWTPLSTAANDPSPLVRRHAAAALRAIANRRAARIIDVNPMGDSTHNASTELRQRMRRFVAWELKDWKRRTPGGFEVDGAIKTLSARVRADVVEVKCGVQLVLSTGTGNAIIMMTSGEAIVQRPKRQFRPAMRSAMELDALEHAVRAAAEEIRQRFVANGP